MSVTTVVPPFSNAVRESEHVIATAESLRVAWSIRDQLYESEDRTLSSAEIAAVRLNREREAAFVEPRMRGRMCSEARRWEPPR